MELIMKTCSISSVTYFQLVWLERQVRGCVLITLCVDHPMCCQSVETGCEAHLQEVQGQLQQQQAEVAQGLVAMKQQTSTDHSALEDHQRELQAHMDGALARVHTFLAEELRQDVPTGEPSPSLGVLFVMAALCQILDICLTKLGLL